MTELDQGLRDELDSIVQNHDVVLFMKGNQQFPQCGFSASAVGILGQYVDTIKTVNVLERPDVRAGIKAYSDWPTIPQLYIKGEFMGGSDIIREMDEAGELADALGVEKKTYDDVSIDITEGAVKAIADAAAANPGLPLRLEVSPRFEYALHFEAAKGNDIKRTFGELNVVLDPQSASRADGLSIDYVTEGEQAGFKITNPNEPATVKQISPTALKAMMDNGDAYVVDVRTPAEREQAVIEGTHLLDASLEPTLMGMDKENTHLVFQCHHGGRSQQAANYFLSQGFKNVYNLTGGIDAWSQEVDATVPRY